MGFPGGTGYELGYEGYADEYDYSMAEQGWNYGQSRHTQAKGSRAMTRARA